MDSVVIGSQQTQMRSEQEQLPSKKRGYQPVRNPHATRQSKKPRVVTCNFEMEIPTNALRIDMSILVSTNDNSSRNCCYETPRPSVTYKITICTPRRQQEAVEDHQDHQKQSTTTATTTTTFRYSSKFTVAKDIDENIVPFHEWNGSFKLGEKKNSTLPLEDCSFHQIQGIFTANYDDDDNDTNKEEEGRTTTTASSTSRKLKKNFNAIDNDDNNIDFLIPPRKKQRLNQQEQQQRQQNLVVT